MADNGAAPKGNLAAGPPLLRNSKTTWQILNRCSGVTQKRRPGPHNGILGLTDL
ncbi:hypothetical protein J3E69DRAFT_336771 [Trichoderma sp. SZMC 28015]